MAQRQSTSHNPSGFSRRGERERVLFIASAGLAFSLLIITLAVLNSRTKSDIKSEAPVDQAPQEEVVGTVSVLTFDQAISAGTKLSGLEGKEAFWRRDKVPAEAIVSRDELKGKYAKVDVPAGQVITRDMLTTDLIETNLPLTPGFRAVSIDVDAVSGVEGHALPGTRVDVLLTYYEEQRLTTKIVIQNARVLSYGGNSNKTGGNAAGARGPRDISRTITLEVAPTDALKIRTASQLGKLSLMMRSNADSEGVQVVEVDQTDLDNNSKKPAVKERCVKQGTIRMNGQEYVMDCDGRIRQMTGLSQ